MNKKKLKTIISRYLNVEPNNIHHSTFLDKTNIKGSVLIHRMFSEIRSEGCNIESFKNIKTYKDLEEACLTQGYKKNNKTNHNTPKKNNKEHDFGIGIDIEYADNLPNAENYFKSHFYLDNFSTGEIAYCSGQKEQKSCFAGKFAAKEAIVKADNRYKDKKFSEIEIINSKEGAPNFDNFHLSITHANDRKSPLAVAVAYIDNKSFEKISSKVENNYKRVYKRKSNINLSTFVIFSLITYILYLHEFFRVN